MCVCVLVVVNQNLRTAWQAWKVCVKKIKHINDTASDVQVTSLSVTGFGLTCLRGAAQQCGKQAKKNKRATAHFAPFRGAVIMSVLLAALLITILIAVTATYWAWSVITLFVNFKTSSKSFFLSFMHSCAAPSGVFSIETYIQSYY